MGELRHAVPIQLLHRPSAMLFDGSRRNVETLRNLTAGSTFGDELQDLTLSAR